MPSTRNHLKFNSIEGFIMRILLIVLFLYILTKCEGESNDFGYSSLLDENKLEILDLLGIKDPNQRMKRHPSLRASASKFLLNVYKELQEDEEVGSNSESRERLRRSLENSEDFVDNQHCFDVGTCNNIITFSNMDMSHSELQTKDSQRKYDLDSGFTLRFNLENVPMELHLISATMRIYQNPDMRKTNSMHRDSQFTVSVYRIIGNRREIYASRNTTAGAQGWLEFDTTELLRDWLDFSYRQPLSTDNEIFVSLTSSSSGQLLRPNDIGLITSSSSEENPFIIAYFNGPDLMAKMHTLRSKRDVSKPKRRFDSRNAPYYQPTYKQPKSCVRLNFTLDFKDLHMQNWVIAPKKFEAYVCSGECNFPLDSKMNATNHAIVQTLMHLKRPHLPKPCCVPTALGSISILHYLNEDSVNLSKYPQSVAKECGCH